MFISGTGNYSARGPHGGPRKWTKLYAAGCPVPQDREALFGSSSSSASDQIRTPKSFFPSEIVCKEKTSDKTDMERRRHDGRRSSKKQMLKSALRVRKFVRFSGRRGAPSVPAPESELFSLLDS